MQKEPAGTKRYLSALKRSKFSRPQLAIFVIAFALIGYLIFRTFAAAPLVALVEGESMVAANSGGTTSASTTTLEAETMALPTGDTVINDTAASGSKAIAMFYSGTANGTVSFPSSVNSFTVTAKGDQCSGAPTMTVAIDGTNILTNTAVSSTSWSTYNGTPATAIASGSHSVTISFTNDYSTTSKPHGKNGKVSGTCDRNLYADKIVFNSPSTTQSSISFVVNDSTASNGQELNLDADGTVTSSFNLPSPAASFTVIAKADVCSGVGAAMNVSVDGTQLLSTTVNSTSLTAYNANSSLNSGSHTLSISFTNDYYVAGTCDRNLYLDVTNFYGPVTVTPPPTVTFSASPTSVTAGQSSTLTWNSANATSCAASGAWSGAQATSGSVSTGALNQNSTYTLTCTGDGGSATASASVSVSPASTPPPTSTNWVPAPPTSYKASGTISFTQLDSVGGSDPTYGLFHPTWQHVVSNQNGLFAVYSYTSSAHNPEYWRLKRSTDGGATWTQLYDSQTASQPSAASSPAVETDSAGNVYVIYQPGNGGIWINGPAKFYKFTASNNFGSPQVVTLNVPDGAKYSTVYDQTRNWIWVAIWELYGSNGTTLYAVDQNGSLVKQIKLWGVEGNSTGWMFPHYPVLTVSTNGTLFVGVTNTDRVTNSSYQNYYDNEFVYSPDGGNTFFGRKGQLTLPIDPVSETQSPMYEITDIGNSSQFISHSSSNYGTSLSTTNWNMMDGFAFNHNALQTYYQSLSSAQPTAHSSYTRFNFSTKQVDNRIEPFRSSTTSLGIGEGGNFIQDTTENGRLYFAGLGTGNDYGKIVVIYSDDGGSTWQDYAKGGSFSSGILYPGAFRWVLSDGSLIGVFESSNNVYFFRVN